MTNMFIQIFSRKILILKSAKYILNESIRPYFQSDKYTQLCKIVKYAFIKKGIRFT